MCVKVAERRKTTIRKLEMVAGHSFYDSYVSRLSLTVAYLNRRLDIYAAVVPNPLLPPPISID